MRLLKQALAVLGTLVLVAAIAALVTPKTAHAIIATFVQVVNTPSQPVPTLATDAHTAFDVSGECFFNTNSRCSIRDFTGTPLYTVPAGQIAVLESTSGSCFNNVGNVSDVHLHLESISSTDGINRFIVLEFTHGNSGGGAVWTWTHAVKSYIPGGSSGTTIDGEFDTDSAQNGGGCFIEIDGHLVSQ